MLNDEFVDNDLQISYEDFQPCDRPEPYEKKKLNSPYRKILENFLASDNETIVKEFDNRSDAHKAYAKFQYFCNQYMKGSVIVSKRGFMIFLIKPKNKEKDDIK